MTKPQSLPWVDPLELAARVAEPYWVLLYSAAHTSYSGHYSYLAHGLAERVEGNDFSVLASKLSVNQAPWGNAWFGYFGYGLKDCLETLTPDLPGLFNPLPLCMMRFHNVYVFDHQRQILTLWTESHSDLSQLDIPPWGTVSPVMDITSNMSTSQYLTRAAHVIERIHAGDLYQANLTRKFFGHLKEASSPFALFKKLCALSPAPYSAFMQMGDIAVASSSPELFLKIGADGTITARPIKGTAPRHQDSAQDKASFDTLSYSAKDRAENLMIVDLMRNDLSRTCAPGSVRVEKLFDVTSHANVHHMASVITGKKRGDCTTLDVIKNAFPPGSMTGAPKIKAMNLCSVLERQARGIYSGALGWLGGDGSAELSVVIRTLLMRDNQFEFQVGGGIVADSTPQQELQELIDKAKGILAALELPPETLKTL